jgi:hypothetical protein
MVLAEWNLGLAYERLRRGTRLRKGTLLVLAGGPGWLQERTNLGRMLYLGLSGDRDRRQAWIGLAAVGSGDRTQPST